MEPEHRQERVVTIPYSNIADEDADISRALEAGFGPQGMGIVAISNVPGFSELRSKLLSLARRLAYLPLDVLGRLEDPLSRYSFGWSHGKESLENGRPDTFKASFYANPLVDKPTCDHLLAARYPSYCRPNLWPTNELPELEVGKEVPRLITLFSACNAAFKDLGGLMVSVGLQLALHCDKHVASQAKLLRGMLEKSLCHKGRLLHYFPRDTTWDDAPWCGWHVDHSALTGLTCATYTVKGVEVPCPDPNAGLYVRTCAGNVVKATFDKDCIAYQAGQASEILSHSRLYATPHCVRVCAIFALSSLAFSCTGSSHPWSGEKHVCCVYAAKLGRATWKRTGDVWRFFGDTLVQVLRRPTLIISISLKLDHWLLPPNEAISEASLSCLVTPTAVVSGRAKFRTYPCHHKNHLEIVTAMDERAPRRRTAILAGHLAAENEKPALCSGLCLSYSSPEHNSGRPTFDIVSMRHLLDGHNTETRDLVFNIMADCKLFHSRRVGHRIFLGEDYNQPMQAQREMTMRRIQHLRDQGIFRGWLTDDSPEAAFRMSAMFECLGIFDHSLAIKLGVHFHLWGGSVKYLGTKRHHDKWLRPTEDYVVKGCFAMTELGHGSNVRGIETVTTYDPATQEFIINTPCESAQKYWIGGAAMHATHTVVFSQLIVSGKNEGVHAFIAQMRHEDGRLCNGIRVADCGHKIGLNGVDNGRIWFDNVRVPRVNLLNSVADVTQNGSYVSSIADPDQRFGAFLAPLTSGRVTIAVSAVYQSKIGLATTIRYALTRRAFAVSPDGPEVLLLDYPSHQHRLLPLLAKTYALSFAAYELKCLYVRRQPANAKIIHVLSSGYKAMFSWHNIKTLQECREACGGQGLKTENKVGQLKAEFDVQLTFEGDNNVLMQQVSKALLADYLTSQKKKQPMKGLGLEHMNAARPELPAGNKLNLWDCDTQISLFRLRERDLLEKLALQVRDLMAEGWTMANSVAESYQLAEDLARAFNERSVLETFLQVESKVPNDTPAKTVLRLLKSLYVATTIDEDPVFLRHGYLTSAQALGVQREVLSLCKELRPHALTLVDAFGIPSGFLGPIAFDWVAANVYEK